MNENISLLTYSEQIIKLNKSDYWFTMVDLDADQKATWEEFHIWIVNQQLFREANNDNKRILIYKY